MLNIPVYPRNGIYYLHTRINGKQVKRSLLTSDKRLATIKALQYLNALYMPFDPDKIRKFNIDIANGIYQADGEDDHRRMIETLDTIGKIGIFKKTQTPPLEAPSCSKPANELPSLRLPELVDKFFNLKKQLKPATATSYRNAANEFAGFLGNPYIYKIGNSDITRYQEHLSKTNHTRTIDNKMGVLSTLFNFAIKQGYYFEDNPAKGRMIMNKKDKARGGYESFENIEISSIYRKDYLQTHKLKDPDFYFCILLGLITGCRISEITSLEVSQIKAEPVPHINIVDSKTMAGVRKVPIPQSVYNELKTFMPAKGKIFKYKDRLGKGSGNAVSQKFKRHMLAIGVLRDKLVFHSLRKYLNHFMLSEAVQIEARCQFFGHELDNVNVTTYAREYTIQDLAKLALEPQQKILDMIKYTP
jgi:integrase